VLRSVFTFLLLYISTSCLFSEKAQGQELYLKLIGSDSTETKTIDSLKYKKLHKNFESVNIELSNFKNRLDHLGYIEHQLVKTERTDSLLTTTFSLNKKYKNLKIFYSDSLLPKKIISSISNNIHDNYFVIPIHQAEKTLEHINLKLSELGDPFNSIKLSNLSLNIEEEEIQASLRTSKNIQKRQIDKIIIKGYEKFPKSYLKYYLKIKEKELFNLTKIKNQVKNLNELQFANQLTDPEILFTKDSTTLYLFLNKLKSNNFDGFIGFGTNEESNTLEFSGYLNLELNNNLNYGESFRLVYKSDENEQKTFNANFNLPYIFGTPLGTELELHLLKKDSSYSTANQSAKIFYQLNPKNKLFAGIRSIQSNNLLDSIYRNPYIKDYKTVFYNIRFQHIKRQKDNFLFNISTEFDLQVETGKREYNKQNTKQHQISLDAYHIFNLNQKNNIYLGLQSFGLISDNYFENELARFGGINSIRGFEENSLFATLFGVFNTEYRYVFNNSLYAHSIIDFAYLENDLLNQKEKLYSFGFGFGLITKAGLLKFNFANGKTENQSFKFSNSQVHLSLTAFF